MPYRNTRILYDCEAAYLAGLIDGEGTVTLCRKHRNENRQLCVSISSTERQMLEWVVATTGVGKITSKRIASKRHSPSFTYAVYNRQALSLLEQTQTWLKTYKRMRAVLILEQYLRLTPRNGHYTPELKDAKRLFEQAVLGLRANCCSESNPS